MADSLIYTTVPGKIPTVLKKIRETGVPGKATVSWLKSIGLTSSNDSTLLGVLRQIGFIDSQGVPQPAWREYRGANHKQMLGRAVVQGYSSLFSTYPDANKRSNEELSHVFSAQTSAGKQAIDKMISTFKNLVKEAEFEGAVTTHSDSESNSGESAEGNRINESNIVGGSPSLPSHSFSGNGMTININVALTLPETSDTKVFEAFFIAMRKHLIEDNLS